MKKSIVAFALGSNIITANFCLTHSCDHCVYNVDKTCRIVFFTVESVFSYTRNPIINIVKAECISCVSCSSCKYFFKTKFSCCALSNLIECYSLQKGMKIC